MKTLIIFMVTALFTGSCALIDSGYDYEMSKSLVDYGVPEFMNEKEIVNWVYANITYHTSNYWQTPEETLQKGSGDCKDKAALFMYICHKQLGLNPDFIGVIVPEGSHAISEIENVFYDPTGYINPSIETEQNCVYPVHLRLSYSDALWQCITFHAVYVPIL